MNHVAVVLASLGLFAAVLGVFGLAAGLSVGGLFLFAASVALLIDFPTGRSSQ